MDAIGEALRAAGARAKEVEAAEAALRRSAAEREAVERHHGRWSDDRSRARAAAIDEELEEVHAARRKE